MSITVITPPATEALTMGEVMAHLRLDSSNQEPAPTAPAAGLLSSTPGNVDNGAHRYCATFVTAAGETQAGTISAAVTVTDKTVGGQVALSAIPTGSIATTARNLYRTKAGGSTLFFLATLADNSTKTYTDNIADSALGVGAPAANTTDDPILNMLIMSARAAAEQELRRYLITQTLELTLDHFPGHHHIGSYGDWYDSCVRGSDYHHKKSHREIHLPPIQSVTSIVYIDTDGNQQTMDSADYLVDARSKPARISLPECGSWPSTARQNNAVTVRFVAGYGAASAVPACIKNWMLIHISNLWENRNSLSIAFRDTLVQIPQTFIDGLLDSERVQGRA